MSNKPEVTKEFKDLVRQIKTGKKLEEINGGSPLMKYSHPVERRLGRSIVKRYSTKQMKAMRRIYNG